MTYIHDRELLEDWQDKLKDWEARLKVKEALQKDVLTSEEITLIQNEIVQAYQNLRASLDYQREEVIKRLEFGEPNTKLKDVAYTDFGKLLETVLYVRILKELEDYMDKIDGSFTTLRFDLDHIVYTLLEHKKLSKGE